ncbi:MAG: hypothetical protein NTNFB02_25710 [Nitrospira sp.]
MEETWQPTQQHREQNGMSHASMPPQRIIGKPGPETECIQIRHFRAEDPERPVPERDARDPEPDRHNRMSDGGCHGGAIWSPTNSQVKLVPPSEMNVDGSPGGSPPTEPIAAGRIGV